MTSDLKPEYHRGRIADPQPGGRRRRHRPAAPDGDIIADYVGSSRDDRFAESARYVRSYPGELPLLAGLLAQIFTPVQIIAGRRPADPVRPIGRITPVRLVRRAAERAAGESLEIVRRFRPL